MRQPSRKWSLCKSLFRLLRLQGLDELEEHPFVRDIRSRFGWLGVLGSFREFLLDIVLRSSGRDFEL